MQRMTFSRGRNNSGFSSLLFFKSAFYGKHNDKINSNKCTVEFHALLFSSCLCFQAIRLLFQLALLIFFPLFVSFP